jgi:hypothetical protein
MPQDFGYSAVAEWLPETDDGREQVAEPAEPVLWITFDGFYRATGEELRTPASTERMLRLTRGLKTLDSDFPKWLAGVEGERADGLVLRFQDVAAVRNVASKLRDRGLEDSAPPPGSRYTRSGRAPEPAQENDMLSLKQAATQKGVPPHDLRRAIEAGELEASEEGGEYFIHAADLEEWEPHPKTAAGADFTDTEAADYLRTADTPS